MRASSSSEKSPRSCGSSELVTGAELLRRQTERGRSRPLATRLPVFDGLQDGGLRRGTLIELCGGRSTGRFAVGLAALAAATRAGESAALVDLGDHLDPRGAQEAGVVLERLLWLRPRRLKEALAGAEMLLAAGFALVVLDLGERSGEREAPSEAWRRLARLTEERGAVLLVVAPRPVSGSSADAVVAALEGRAVWLGEGLSPRLLAGISVRLWARRRRSPERGGTLSLAFREEER